MTEHEASESVYHKLEEALIMLKHEGQEPWHELYYAVLGNYYTKRNRGFRKTDEQITWGYRRLSETAKDLPIDWKESTLNTRNMTRLVRIIDGIPMTNLNEDSLAIAYNLFNPVKMRYEEGIFFTPPHLIRFIVKQLQPKYSEAVMDLGSGTGVFLREVLDYLHLPERRMRVSKQHDRWGIEKNPVLCSLSRTIDLANTLYGDALNIELIESSYDIVFSNPPFGVQVDAEIARQYELGSSPVGTKSETLFIERAIRLARPEVGRIALILSEEVFENPKYAEVLQYIRDNTQILREYRLPRSTFQMSFTDVKTRLLFLLKTQSEMTASYQSSELVSLTELDNENASLCFPNFSPFIQTASHVSQGTLQEEEQEWSEIISNLILLRKLNQKIESAKIRNTDSMNQVYLRGTEGAIRDYVMDYLDLRLFDGLDGDVLDLFHDIQSGTREGRQEEAFQIAKEHIAIQVKRGNTFFLDPIAMSDYPELGSIVADISEVRNRQILGLEENPPLVDVYSTYYGFTILTQGSIQQRASGASSDALDTFTSLASQIGTDISLNHKQLKYSKTAFGRVSDHTRRLLWNLLSLSIAGENNRKKAARELGEMRDSRAIPLLALKLHSKGHSSTIKRVMNALEYIGRKECIEPIESLDLDDWTLRRVKRDALSTLKSRHNVR